VWAIGAAAALPASAAADGSLFDASEALVLELALDFGELCRGTRSERCDDARATLTYARADGVEQRIPVAVRARGRWRNESGNCSVPPLAVLFDSSTTAGTLFAGETMLPMTTHCRDRPAEYEQYVLKEHLAYGIYNALADKSPRARLAHVTYRDTGRRDRTVERYAFFTEHFAAVAARNGAQYWPTDDFDPRDGDPQELATLELFEFMIGNTDWSAVRAHNVAHIRAPGGAVSALAYDFDFSGIVDAPYALPPPQLPIRRVTQRLYRGFCHPGLDWVRLFAHFQDRRNAIETVIERQVDALEAAHRAAALAYVREFFAIIASPERRQTDVIGACRAMNDRS
jgi:hypothetical protein